MSLMPKKKPLENAAKTDVRKLLDKHNWRHWANAAGPFSVHGIPDRMAVRDGMFMAIEVKRAGGAVTSLQRKFLQDVQAAGHFAFVVDPARMQAFANFLESLDISIEAQQKHQEVPPEHGSRMLNCVLILTKELRS